MSNLIEVLEMTDRHRFRWPFETWKCGRGEDCCYREPSPLGVQLVEYNDVEQGAYVTPYIAVFYDGTALMVCEDCAVELEGPAADLEGP